jgi:hypothetical protein
MALTKEQEELEKTRQTQVFQEYLHSTEYQEKLVKRLELNDAADRRAEARTYLWHLCARPDNPAEGAKFFINTFGWTMDPRPEHSPKHLPFFTFPYQDQIIKDFIEHVDNSRDWFIEKSRDMGVSWLVFVWLPIWYWLFRDGINMLVGSYKEDLVDNRTIDSLFGKIDYSILSLPKWLLPPRFRLDKHRTHMRLNNPANGNLITGDTMNADFGRGARKTAILFDELGSWDYAKDAWESCADSTSCRIANSTPKGYNFYAMLRESGIDISTYHWKDHPFKDAQWYVYEQNRRTEEEVAQELDISYTKSREGRVYPEWGEQNVNRGLFVYDDDLPLYVGWDFGKTDDTAIIWAQEERGGGLRIIETYAKAGKNIDFFVPFITGTVNSDLAEKYQYTSDELEIIREHGNWKKGTHYGDPAGRFVNAVSDETVFSVLRKYGIFVNFKDHWKEFKIRKRATKTLLNGGINLNENKRTKYFNICILNAAYPKIKHEGMEIVRSDKPKHDSTSHYRSALEYLALGLEENSSGARFRVHDKFPKKPASPGNTRRATTY